MRGQPFVCENVIKGLAITEVSQCSTSDPGQYITSVVESNMSNNDTEYYGDSEGCSTGAIVGWCLAATAVLALTFVCCKICRGSETKTSPLPKSAPVKVNKAQMAPAVCLHTEGGLVDGKPGQKTNRLDVILEVQSCPSDTSLATTRGSMK